MTLYRSIEETIGNTPLVELRNIERELGLKARLFAKVEFFNPAGSVKDRIAKAMLDDLEASGKIGKDAVIIEPTSGNTGIGLASVAAARGYRAIIVMPETMSVERRKLMKAYGAELVLTKGSEGMKGAVNKAEELHKEIPGSVIPGQFVNPSNPRIHFETTGPEIYRDLDGKVDVLVAGVGTGGTVSGIGKFLKSKNPKTEVVAVEPARSPLLSEGKAGPHGIQGIGANFVPDTLDRDVYDRIIKVSDDDAYNGGRLIGRKEGILVGISSGAALSAAIEIAKDPAYAGKNIVAIMPDTGERYLSTPMFGE
ncbi:MAG: cysteine synthase A [Candidatus Methanomethylophilaceae archaeon]|nr:cysteine synthase A [Candidatus Methanomethylophilaceae archaeon]MBR3477028.1 cysteine synthase A [Candidatus Methanomethylophilaceae archaeon]MBR4697873.1 cysteine synthase A [Candidatus Methanomethylophilaceae archaeon]MBR6871145.1 cysteine synthase A [Candidatus Methanomethylophilaceae archaeon]